MKQREGCQGGRLRRGWAASGPYPQCPGLGDKARSIPAHHEDHPELQADPPQARTGRHTNTSTKAPLHQDECLPPARPGLRTASAPALILSDFYLLDFALNSSTNIY